MKPLSIILLIICSLTAVITTLGFMENHQRIKLEHEPSVEFFYLNELVKSTIYNESLPLNNPMVYSGNDTENKFNLFDIVADECLVFRFSGEACNVCIDFVIMKLKERFPDYYENSRILLIGSNINNRVKENYYGKKVLSYCSENLGLPFEDYNTPFLFIVDRDRICKMMFIPEKASPEFTDIYLETIFTRYFELSAN